MENKKAGFWIRLLARLFDMLLVSAISIGLAFALMNQVHFSLPTQGGWHTVNAWIFKGPWAFYIWAFSFMGLIFLSGIGIPLLTKGCSLGQLLFRIKVVSKDGNLVKGIIKREAFFTWSWLFTSLLVTACINHTLIDQFARTDKYGVVFSSWENARIGIVTAVGSITVFIQMIVAISGLVRADKTGLHDVYANTLTIWKNKYNEKTTEPKRANNKHKKPEATHNAVVEWVN